MKKNRTTYASPHTKQAARRSLLLLPSLIVSYLAACTRTTLEKAKAEHCCARPSQPLIANHPKIMKKIFFALMLSALLFSCSKDEDVSTINHEAGKYSNGVFILNEGNMTDETGTLSFIDSKNVLHDSIFIKENPGHKLGNVCQDMDFFGNNAYIISQKGTVNGGDGYLVVANAASMKLVASYNNEMEAISSPSHVAVVNDSKVYIRDNNGIMIFDLATKKLSAEPIEGTQGANKIKMVKAKGKVFVGVGSSLVAIDPATDKVTKTVDLEGGISGIVLGRDGNIWASVGTKPGKMVKVSTDSHTIMQTNTVPDNISLDGGWIPSIGLCASMNEDALFFRKGTNIYKHTYTGAGTTEVFINTKEKVEDGNMIYGDINVNPTTGKLYVCTIKGYGMNYKINAISEFDSKVSAAATLVFKNRNSFPAGIFFTPTK